MCCLLEEQCDPKTYGLLSPDEDSIAVTIKKMTKSFENLTQELIESVDDLNSTMKRIEQIQKKALKWQEVFG